MRFAVIMSGGSGRRFWPVSRSARAKQLIPLIGDKTLLELTVERLSPLFPPESILVVTQKRQYAETVRVLERFGRLRVLSEPIGRNTAACIAYAANYIMCGMGDAVIAFLPADHFIESPESFRKVLSMGMDFVERTGKHLTLGIKPDRPATGFGYIKRGLRVESYGGLDFFGVADFTEKPSLEAAQTYVETGEYLWNAGIFVFKASSILRDIETYLPEVARGFRLYRDHFGAPDEVKQLATCYSSLPSISIDYGVMEKTEAACVVPAEFGWDDLGNWDSFSKYLPTDSMGNAVHGKHIGIDSEDCLVYGDGPLITTLGVSGMTVVATGDAVLIMPRERGEEVRRIVERLQEEDLEDLL